MTHLFRREIIIPLARARVFAFFGDALNLEAITPPELNFRILTPAPIEMRAGTVIDYRLRLLGFPFRWKTLIHDWDPPRSFADHQLRGPYRSWRHTHRFTEEGEGTRMADEVLFELPLSPPSELFYPLVRFQLARIFGFRNAAIRRLLLGGSSTAAAPGEESPSPPGGRTGDSSRLG